MPNIPLTHSWLEHIGDEFEKPYMQQLDELLTSDQSNILPQAKYRLNALISTPFEKVKVIIIGQDPYPTPGHAHGLCFSVLPDVKPLPKSLKNINQELLSDINVDNSHTGYLQPWAEQGVLLLNAVLTVEAHKANSHQGLGWETFTDMIIDKLNTHKEHCVFILWGGYAQKKGRFIDTNKHLVIQSPHPSPLSAYRGFFGSRPFSRTNDYLLKTSQSAIHWQL